MILYSRVSCYCNRLDGKVRLMRLKIAIDVDDVLAESAIGFVNFSNERWGTSLTVDDYDEHWVKMWNIDNNEMIKRSKIYDDAAIIRDYNHIGGAYEVLRRLSNRHELMVATARKTVHKDDTLLWIEYHFPNIFNRDLIFFAGIWDDLKDDSHILTKGDLINQVDADVLIDDQLKHCISVAESGRRAIVFGDYSWNKCDNLPERVTRCSSWIEVEEEIERIATTA